MASKSPETTVAASLSSCVSTPGLQRVGSTEADPALARSFEGYCDEEVSQEESKQVFKVDVPWCKLHVT